MKFNLKKNIDNTLNNWTTCRELFSLLKNWDKFIQMSSPYLNKSSQTTVTYLWLHFNMLTKADDVKTAELECIDRNFKNQKGKTIQEPASDREVIHAKYMRTHQHSAGLPAVWLKVLYLFCS